MGNFYKDNKDIENVIDALDLTEVATLLEEDFKFAKEYDFAPKDAADAIDNYKRAIDICGDESHCALGGGDRCGRERAQRGRIRHLCAGHQAGA